MVARKSCRPVLSGGRAAAAVRNELGKFSSHVKFCAVSRDRRRNACRSHDSASFALVEDAAGTIRRVDPRGVMSIVNFFTL